MSNWSTRTFGYTEGSIFVTVGLQKKPRLTISCYISSHLILIWRMFDKIRKRFFFWHFKCISHVGFYIQNGLLDLIKRLVPTSTIPCMLHNCTPQNGFPWISSHTHDTRGTPEVRVNKCISLFSCLCVEHLRVPYPIFLPYKRDVTHVVF